MATTALILHVQRTTGSATAVGLVLFAQAIPPLAAPLAGVIADRFSPGRLLAVGWLTQAVLAGLAQPGAAALGAMAGETRIRQVLADAKGCPGNPGAAPFNIVLEARP